MSKRGGSQRIDLGAMRTHQGKVFSGRKRGEACRKEAGLDQLDRESGVIAVRVPEEAYAVNSSFFLGMFGPSVRHLGEEEFRRRYKFEGKDITATIEDGIREALDTRSPFDDSS